MSTTNITEQDFRAFLLDALQSLGQPGHLLAGVCHTGGGYVANPPGIDFTFFPAVPGHSSLVGKTLDELRAKVAAETPENVRARRLAEARELVAKLEAECATSPTSSSS